MEFKDEKQFGDGWLPVIGKLLVLLGIVFILLNFARSCHRQETKRVRLGGTIELGDTQWGGSK